MHNLLKALSSIEFRGLGKKVSCAKTTKPIEMPSIYGGQTFVGSRNHLLEGMHIGATWQIKLNTPCCRRRGLLPLLLRPLGLHLCNICNDFKAWILIRVWWILLHRINWTSCKSFASCSKTDNHADTRTGFFNGVADARKLNDNNSSRLHCVEICWASVWKLALVGTEAMGFLISLLFTRGYMTMPSGLGFLTHF